MHPLVNIAVSAARAAGNFIMRHFERADQLQIEKKGRNDFVTQVDRGAEREIVSIIRKAYPQHAILAEEGGASGDSDVCWIVDPLDGTTNFLHRLPHFAVSIGVQVKGRLEHGVIYAPCTQDLYCASRGEGAVLNNRKLRVSQVKDLDQALIGTGVPIRATNLDAYLPMLSNVVGATAGVRRAGAASLDLAYVAAGRLDAFWELQLKPWDIAAGIVLVQEAGGVVRGVYKDDEWWEGGNVLAANQRLVNEFTQLVRTVDTRRPAAPSAQGMPTILSLRNRPTRESQATASPCNPCPSRSKYGRPFRNTILKPERTVSTIFPRQENPMAASIIDVTLAIWDLNRERTLATLQAIEGLPDPRAVLGWRPGPGRAHIGWQLMHIGITEELFATERLLGTVAAYAELIPRFKGGSTPDDNIPAPDVIRDVLSAAREHLRNTMSTFTDADLGIIPPAFRERGLSIGKAIQILAWHEAHHQGQSHITLNLYKAAHK